MRKITLWLFAAMLFSYIGAKAQSDVIVLDLSKPTSPTEITLNEQGYWDKTYSTADKWKHLEFGLFSLTHCIHGFGGDDVGGGMSYWDGFTYCTSGDATDYGISGSSDGWVPQQWGCIAGGGIKTDEQGNVVKDKDGVVVAEKGKPYIVAYWGYWEEDKNDGIPACQIDFTDGKLYFTHGIYVCNHPWPYYGNIHGDGFARPFTEENDSFKLYIHGLNEYGKPTGGIVEYTLADTKGDANGYFSANQSNKWEWVDLSSLGSVSGIYFTMSSTDSDPIYGMNTACYFCIDKLTVSSVPASERPSRPSELECIPSETTLECTWEAPSSGSVAGYNVYVNDKLYAKVTETIYTVEHLSPYTDYTVKVEAYSSNGEISDPAILQTKTTDETKPTTPASLQVTEITNYTISVSWEASSDNVGVTEYHIYLNGERFKRITGGGLSYTLTALDADTEYTIAVEARDEAGNRSEQISIQARTQSTGTAIQQTELKPHVCQDLTTNYLYLTLTRPQKVRIYNLHGMKLIDVQGIAGENTIDLSDYPAGIYILLSDEISQRIIKKDIQ